MMISRWKENWKKDRLTTSLLTAWYITVFSSFFGSCLFSFRVPGIGQLYLFRLILPVTCVLYLVALLKKRRSLLKDVTVEEVICWILILSMLLYSVVSLFRAMNFSFTFARFFNLCFDLAFFFLVMRLCRDRNVLRNTLVISAVCILLLWLMGLYEIFNGGIFNPVYDDFKRLFLFERLCQYPVVTFGNTNDYAAALTFTAAILLLFVCYHWNRIQTRQCWMLIAAFGMLYFIAEASTARLVVFSIYILLMGFTAFLLVQNRRRLWIIAGCLLCVFCVQFVLQYRFIVPPIQTYLAEKRAYEDAMKDQPGTSFPDAPKLEIGDPNHESLKDTFYTEDKETGEKDLSARSNGMRVLLILHAFRCFKDSHFLGVGLGNTEMLAAQEDIGLTNIHCFVARLLGDYGIFVLLPLAAIAVLLLRSAFRAFFYGLRHNRRILASGLMFFFVLLTYPILSTISSDAQDILPMWLYLACIVCFADQLRQEITFGGTADHFNQIGEKV